MFNLSQSAAGVAELGCGLPGSCWRQDVFVRSGEECREWRQAVWKRPEISVLAIPPWAKLL